MDEAAVRIVMDTLKESAMDLVVMLPEEPTHALPESTQRTRSSRPSLRAGKGTGSRCVGRRAVRS